ncbi:thioredoxin-dependent thiol peroxidase [Kordiimonas sp. SCSIO 12610]|uniref:thioredoxin-dependent thiol peroxidase n=1 Tax=Kordiimonas sp. SCSIO 12610 TaxID=2829597 RepID=UPI00210B8108|nr:thioredoxin-dependent thiol peroxidase [Kordiimonas sp. SCSIO 12610]UTW53852.1 thioredoxin-dependent thiol peroxidase [Kordiimonas sp. SCSIO 12610]
MTLSIGDKAPSFSLPANGDQTISLSDYAGKNVVLYFYPKDSTPGCTTEAKDFTSLKNEFDAANTVILGASKDSVRRHNNFIAKQELAIDLVSDEEGEMIEAYGVWVEKSMYGKKYMGIERATYLIDANGIIQQIWRKVKVKGHAEAVLEAAKAL